MVVEKPDGGKTGSRDWFGAIYFGFFGLVCYFEFLSRNPVLSEFSLYPLLYVLLIWFGLMSVLLLAYIVNSASSIRFSMRYAVSKMRALYHYAFKSKGQTTSRSLHVLVWLFFLATAIKMVLDYLGPRFALDIMSHLSLAFIALAIAQIAISTKTEKTEGGKDPLALLWIKAVVNNGAASIASIYLVGFAMVVLLFFSEIAADPRMNIFAFLFVFPLFFLVLTYAVSMLLKVPCIFDSFKLTKKRLVPPLIAITLIIIWFTAFPIIFPIEFSDRFKPFFFAISAYAALAYTCFANSKPHEYLGFEV